MVRSLVYEVPVLRPRSHTHPARGGCLLEIVSTLPDGPWTDHPSSVDPVLAALGRAVNDRTTPAGRRRLLALAPWMITAGPAGSEQITTVVRDLAAARLGNVDERFPGPDAVPLDQRRPDWLRRWQLRHRAIVLARSAVRAAAVGPEADRSLLGFLLDVVNQVRRLENRGSVRIEDSDNWPDTLPVRVEMRVPDGSESRYLHCSAEMAGWPVPLREAWRLRAAELAAARSVKER